MRSLVLLWLGAAAVAQDARQIVQESQRRGHVKSEKYEGSLRVEESGRNIAEKRWQYVRSGSYGDSKAVLRFTAPPEVRGVALLIVNHPDRSSDQWMWTPAIGRERRIAYQDRKTRFFGTDFSFEDLEERDVNHFDYRLLGEEAAAGVKCWRIEARPRQSKSSQYTHVRIWIRQTDYVPARTDSFIGEQAVRRLNYEDIGNVQNIWVARTLDMRDLRRNSRTVLKLEKLQFNVPVDEGDFTVAALRRSQ